MTLRAAEFQSRHSTDGSPVQLASEENGEGGFVGREDPLIARERELMEELEQIRKERAAPAS